MAKLKKLSASKRRERIRRKKAKRANKTQYLKTRREWKKANTKHKEIESNSTFRQASAANNYQIRNGSIAFKKPTKKTSLVDLNKIYISASGYNRTKSATLAGTQENFRKMVNVMLYGKGNAGLTIKDTNKVARHLNKMGGIPNTKNFWEARDKLANKLGRPAKGDGSDDLITTTTKAVEMISSGEVTTEGVLTTNDSSRMKMDINFDPQNVLSHSGRLSEDDAETVADLAYTIMNNGLSDIGGTQLSREF